MVFIYSLVTGYMCCSPVEKGSTFFCGSIKINAGNNYLPILKNPPFFVRFSTLGGVDPLRVFLSDPTNSYA